MTFTIWQMAAEFSEWLQAELETRGWRQTDLAKRTGLADAVISRILKGHRRPQGDTLRAIARALKLDPLIVFRAAGELPPEVDADPWVERNAHRLAEMPEELRPIAEDLLEGLLRQQEQRKAAERKNKQRRA